MPENKGTVLYVGGFELPDRNPAAHRVLNNAKILKELGYKVVFCGIDKEITSISENPQFVEGFESYPIAYPKSTKQWIKQMIDISHYKAIISKYDIKLIIGYNLHAIPLAKLLKIAKSKGLKVVADCTEWYENKFSLNPIKLIKCVDTFFTMRVLQKKCDGMIAISSFLADYYKKYIKNTIVLPPLVDLEDEKYINNKNENETPILVYSGSPSASKEALGDVVKALNKKPFIGKIIGGIAAEAIMVLGYFGYEAVILGYGLAAAGSIFSNVMQGIVGIVAGIAVTTAIEKNKTINSFLKR